MTTAHAMRYRAEYNHKTPLHSARTQNRWIYIMYLSALSLYKHAAKPYLLIKCQDFIEEERMCQDKLCHYQGRRSYHGRRG